ncbi:MAG: divalent-cation tolerance protein CutA, partial [candidate division Zixibacteria bacterium]|nr:divalent-cation tolerance protein CutA [candidate division Zixibacteria bacterium]
DKAEELAQKVIVSGLAACVNIVDNAKSIYKWEGELKTDTESILFFKTATKKVENLIKSIREDHPYKTPEIISMTISEGNPDYLNWIDSATTD